MARMLATARMLETARRLEMARMLETARMLELLMTAAIEASSRVIETAPPHNTWTPPRGAAALSR